MRAPRTITGKLLLVTGAAITAIILIDSIWSGLSAARRVEDQVTELALENAGRAAQQVATELTSATAAGTTLAGSLSTLIASGGATRDDVIALLEGVPAQHEGVVSSWMTGLTDGALDALLPGEAATNEAGIFTPYWRTDSSGQFILSTFEIAPQSEWYALPLTTGASLLTEPYVASSTGDLLTSLSAPVRVDGRIVGLAGVDIDLGDLSAMIGSLVSFEGGRTLLVDSNGKWLAHPDRDRLTLPYEDMGSDILAAALEDGQPRVMRAMPDGSTRLIYPFTAPGMNRTWAAILDVPGSYFSGPVQREMIAVVVVGLSILLMTLLVIKIAATRIVRRPLGQVVTVLDRLASGGIGDPVPETGRDDEVGGIARSVEALRQGLVEKQAMEAGQQRQQQEQAHVTQTLARNLRALSSGQLDTEIHEDFPDSYEQLRKDFNETVQRLAELIRAISSATGSISASVGEIASASTDLSRRTESSAATLEETAAALSEMTGSVRGAADGAKRADEVAVRARSDAQDSARIVEEAVTAMDAIGDSSQQITKIIGVIGDIAFQTNLLALNAGVEAARAGEAGGGFAVVASEVRALAQRSSEAAREIEALISTSGTQVEQGVALVGRAGKALTTILGSISDISDHVSRIASASNEQATAIGEINTAVGQLDQAQQQNAAMFEETAAACTRLNGDMRDLSEVISRFRGAEAVSAGSEAA